MCKTEQFTYNEAEVSNALIEQKNMLMQRLRDYHFETVLTVLESCRFVWKHLGYSYKIIELAEEAQRRIQNRAQDLAPQAHKQRAALKELSMRFYLLESNARQDKADYFMPED